MSHTAHTVLWLQGVALAAAIAGCSNLRLESPLHARHDDWPTYGGSNVRTNAAPVAIEPPLTQDWEADVNAGIGNGSPLIVDSTIFIGNLRGELCAFKVRTGQKIGSLALGEAIQGSPVIDGNLAIIGASDTKESLIAFDLLEGKPRWKRSYGDIEVSVMVLANRIYFGNTTGTFYCIDREAGDMVWSFAIPDNSRLKGIRSTPSARGSTVVFGADDGVVYALNAESGRLLWKYPTGSVIVASLTIADSSVLVANLGGTVTSLDLAAGTLRWKYVADGPIRGNAALVGERAVFGSLTGTMFALHTSDGALAWKTALDSPVNSAAVAAGTVIYVGTLKKTLVALRASSGEILWKGEVEGRIKTSPAVACGRLFVATDERTILSFHGAGQ